MFDSPLMEMGGFGMPPMQKTAKPPKPGVMALMRKNAMR